MRVCENKMLRRVLNSGGCKTLHDEVLHSLSSSTNIGVAGIRRMGWAEIVPCIRNVGA
jgi:hypothetical protein